MTPARLVQLFASLGHGLMHMMAVYFYLVVLPLERDWGVPYAELITFWTVGSFMVGAMAMPAGWLADRWSARGMMAVFFLGLGASSMLCGLAGGRTSLWIGLTLLGSFAAIYHPVGIPWLVRTATGARGRVIGINGVFGNAGVAAAGAVAGVLIDVAGWRAAFLVPGVICLVLGVAMVYCIAAGRLPAETHEPAVATPVRSARDRSRVFRTLFVTMICGALVYQAAQAALPKLLALRVASGDGGGTLGVGMLMGLVYGVASLSQVVAGHLADRHSWKLIYASAFAVQVPLLWLIAPAAGAPFVVLATLVVICNTAGLPAENLLLSQSASRHRQGLAFGAKFVVSFGATPAAIWLVSLMSSTAGGFASLFLVLSAVAGGGALAAALLPAGGGTAVSPAPASEAAAANVP